MRAPLVAGNWKMNKTRDEAVALVRALRAALPEPPCAVVLCPPFTALDAVAGAIAGSPFRLGAQDLHAEPRGAFTGEISAEMLLAAGCTHVIVGHSERRQYAGESDADVARKATAADAAGLVPIVCVGETLDERERGDARAVVERQLDAALAALPDASGTRLVIAYEPVWAIGTGRTATPAQAQEMHAVARARLQARFGAGSAETRVLYGGSVTPENAADLFAMPDVDGALVGGASLRVESFAPIVLAAAARGAPPIGGGAPGAGAKGPR